MFHHLLLPLDGSALAECALPHAIAFARAFEMQVTLLRTLHAPSPDIPIDIFDWQLQKAEAEAYVERIATQLQAAGIPTETMVVEGRPANAVIEHIQRNQIDLVALCSHGAGGLTNWPIEGMAQEVLFHAYRSSLLIRAHQPVSATGADLRYQRILVPLDGSRRAECVLPFATKLAHSHGAQLVLAHVFRRPEMPRQIPLSPEDQELAEQLVARNRAYMYKHLDQLNVRLPADTEIRLLERDDVVTGLHELALSEQIDLVIMSAHGHMGSNLWPYGSVATHFIVYGATSLLLIQDLLETDCAPTPAAVAMNEQREHLYMASERFSPKKYEASENAVKVLAEASRSTAGS